MLQAGALLELHASFISPLSMGSKCLRAWGLSSKTWGLSDLDPNLIIANQI